MFLICFLCGGVSYENHPLPFRISKAESGSLSFVKIFSTYIENLLKITTKGTG